MASQEQVEKCIHLLSHKSTDDEKFAGLLLLPHMVDAQDADAWTCVFDAMDIHFIEQLMHTRIKQSSSAADHMLLSIAVSVIDMLVSHAHITASMCMLEHILMLCTVATMNIDCISAEAVLALSKLLAQDAAIDMVLKDPAMLIRVINMAPECPEPHQIVQFLNYALNHSSQFVCAHQDPEVIQGLVATVACTAAAFTQSHSVLKFEQILALANVLKPMTTEDAAVIDELALCLLLAKSVSTGCIVILKQKTKATQYTDQVLTLYLHLVWLWPQHVFLGLAMQNTAAGTAADTVDQKEAKLVLRLSCVEGQAAIVSMMITPPDAQNKMHADCERIQHGWKLSVCAEIAAAWLEWVTQWLDDQPPDLAAVNESAIYAMMNEMQKLASSIIGFMLDWKECVSSKKTMLETGPELIASTVHFLAQWLATDPKLHRAAMPVLPMCTAWIQSSNKHGPTIAKYVCPCISFALESCGISEAQYTVDLMTHQLHHDCSQAQEFASPWVGTIEFDDLARAVYSIPSDEELLRDQQA
ncbi:hypothetical protein IWW50_000746 [Coemansia erecta]|nr:hypothetical protein GGF43_000683 [Coemansia sp. RSA 2618]KAJ2829636.1 hypothetical protein IWW50_000746 [Coemansia erecta]